MRIFEFTITIDRHVEDHDEIDAFYGKTVDASVAGSEGKTLIHFDREAPSLDDALRSAIIDVRGQGWQVREITVEPDCMLPVASG